MTAEHVAILLTILGAVATICVYAAVDLLAAVAFAVFVIICIAGGLLKYPAGRTASTSV